MADLRTLLRERVQQSRREEAASLPRRGLFTQFEDEAVIHFTTRGRRSGHPREKWWLPFAPDGDVLYLLEENGTAANWVKNALADPRVTVEGIPALARLVDEQDELARARQLCSRRFGRVGLVVADLVERGLVVALEPHT